MRLHTCPGGGGTDSLGLGPDILGGPFPSGYQNLGQVPLPAPLPGAYMSHHSESIKILNLPIYCNCSVTIYDIILLMLL